jgi:hypothetical protein
LFNLAVKLGVTLASMPLIYVARDQEWQESRFFRSAVSGVKWRICGSKKSPLSTEEIPVSSEKSSDLARHRRLRVGLTLLLAAAALAAVFFNVWASGAGLLYLYQQAQTFVTIFLGILSKRCLFLLAGSLVSGLIAVFVDQSAIDRYLPKSALPGALVGATLGVVFAGL